MGSNEIDKSGGETDGKTVSLEVFITDNWEILTIFGVFVGVTNYMSVIENSGLVTLSFLMTFIVELEILMLLVKTKNKSLLLNAFTLLSAIFMVAFAGVIFSNHVSSILSKFDLVIYPIVTMYRATIVKAIFFISILIVVLGMYKYLSPLAHAVNKKFSKNRKKSFLGVFSAGIVIGTAFAAYILFSMAPIQTAQKNSGEVIEKIGFCPQDMILINGRCCIDKNLDNICDIHETTSTTSTSTTTTSTTTTTLGEIACFEKSDCGVNNETRLCYKEHVYLQKSTPICQKPGTEESRCVIRTNLVGETITSEAIPFEKCSKGCRDGFCID